MAIAIFFLGRHSAGKEDVHRLKKYFDCEKITSFNDLKNAFLGKQISEIIFAHSSVLNFLAFIFFPFCQFKLVVHNPPDFQSRSGFWGKYDQALLKIQLLLVSQRIFLSLTVQEKYRKKSSDIIIKKFVHRQSAIRIPTDKSKILFFGRYLRYKNVELVYRLAEYFPKIKFTIASEGCIFESTVNCEVISNFIDNDEVNNLYKNHDILILPYHDVSQSGPFYIGYEKGLLIICSDLPFFRKFELEENVIIVDENKLHQYQKCLRDILDENH